MASYVGGSGRASVALGMRQQFGGIIMNMRWTNLKRYLKEIGVKVRIGTTTEETRELAMRHIVPLVRQTDFEE